MCPTETLFSALLKTFSGQRAAQAAERHHSRAGGGAELSSAFAFIFLKTSL